MPVLLRDAWGTLVPDMSDRHGPLPPLMLALTVVTGLVDAVSYLQLGRVFVANMTGNVVFSGFAFAGAAGFSLAASLVALAAFATGALLGGLLVHRTHAHRGRMLQYALLAETVCVAAALIVTVVSGTRSWEGPASPSSRCSPSASACRTPSPALSRSPTSPPPC